ncbi:MAG: protein kinase domain-containing protein, partial [Gammaproteobacteria bacterium]
MAKSRLFPALTMAMRPIPFIPAHVDLNCLYSDSLLLIKDELLPFVLQEYGNTWSIGFHAAGVVAQKARLADHLFADEQSDFIYDILVREEEINGELDIAIYAVCQDEQKLGEGAFGKVLPVQRLNGPKKGLWFAVKVVTVQDEKQLSNAFNEEEILHDLGLAGPNTPRSSISDASYTLDEPVFEEPVRRLRKTLSTRTVSSGTSGSEERKDSMQRSGSVKIRKGAAKLAWQSPGSTASSPVQIQTHLAVSPATLHRGRSTSHIVPKLKLTELTELKVSTEILRDITDRFGPPLRSNSPIFLEDFDDATKDNMRYEYDIFMDLVNGESLKTIFDREQIATIPDVLRMQMAIDFAEELRNLICLDRIHCDIKPQNVMYNQFSLKAHFIDFGDARRLDPQTKQCVSDQYNGTTVFMAPELRQEAVKLMHGDKPNFLANEKTEVYALGILIADIFNLHSDTAPSIGSEDAYVRASYDMHEQDSTSVLEYHILQLIHRATATNPAERISLKELQQELTTCMTRYVEEKEINVCAFDISKYSLADNNQQDLLFKQAVEDYHGIFDELWFVGLMSSTQSSKDYVELRRKFEKEHVLVGDGVAIGQTIRDALKCLDRHLGARSIKSNVQKLEFELAPTN